MNNNYQQSNSKMDLNNFNLSDSDSESDNETNIDIAKSNTILLDKLELQYFPEPYLSLGQFILSSIVGASVAFIVKSRADKTINSLAFNNYLDIYYKYCNNSSTSDDYLNELLVKFNFLNNESSETLESNQTQANEKNTNLLNKSNEYAKELASIFFVENIDILNTNLNLSDVEFNIEQLNVELVKKIVPMIKFSKLSQII